MIPGIPPFFNCPNFHIHQPNNFALNNPSIPYIPKKNRHICSDKKENSLNNDFQDKNSDIHDEYFEILGLKLHFDDLLIICILIVLYQEDVKDTYLYVALILLLLS